MCHFAQTHRQIDYSQIPHFNRKQYINDYQYDFYMIEKKNWYSYKE